MSSKKKLLISITTVELLFLLFFKFLLDNIPHFDHELIYYVNINVIFLISVFGWYSFFLGRNNKVITSLFSIWFSILTLYSIFFIFSSLNFSDEFNYLNFHVLYIFSTTFQFIISSYLFFLSLISYKSKLKIILLAFIVSGVIALINYVPIFTTNIYKSSYDPLFIRNYYMQIVNFSILVIFWHQYTKMRIIFSEYLPNIISVYTIIIGIEIFQSFSSQNELLFHYFAQYFNLILYLVILGLFIARINYLNDPKSITNENYIRNYTLLHNFIDKPRRGLFVEFYSNINKSGIVAFIVIMIFLGIYLYWFNKFKIFLRLNILLLILSSIISLILAIFTWHKRWYSLIGIFFKKDN